MTGASGFLGGHLCRALKTAGRDVLGVARRPLEGFPARQVADYRQTPGGDLLIHLAESSDRAAALAAGDAYVEQALTTLEALLQGGYQGVVYASSGAVYGDSATAPRRVGDPMPADNPYDRGKVACEGLVAAAGRTSVRLANVYGPGMAANNAVSTILAQIPGTGPLRVRDGAPVRDFLWIEDAVAGLVALVDRAEAGLYNLGSGRGVALRDLARMALVAAGEGDRPLEETQPSGRTSHLVLDVAATEAATGWRPQVTAEEGMARLVEARMVKGQGGSR